MLSKHAWARAAALTGAIAVVTAAFPVAVTVAQEAPSVALEQARRGEDGTSSAGAPSGSLETGSSKRDKNGNGGNASAGSAGDVTSGAGSSGSTDSPPLPANAELLSALGILDDVEIYGLDILDGMNIPVELLPPPPAETAPSAPADINTGGQSSDGANVSTNPGDGSAPAGGSTTSSAADGAGSSSNGEKTHDRPRKNADSGTNTDGGTATDTSGSGGAANSGS